MGGGERTEQRLVIMWSLDGGGDGRMDGESLSVLCLAASQLSRLMEIPSLIAAAPAVCVVMYSRYSV